jgi:hypothetical protein
MFSIELKDLIPQVITSWQVLVITGVLILYTWFVNYVARTYHRPHFVSKSKPKRKKEKAAPAGAPQKTDDAGS